MATKRYAPLFWILTLGLLLLAAGPAHAVVTCDSIGAGGECVVSTLKNLTGAQTVDGNRALRIVGPAGEIRATPGSILNLTITGTAVINGDTIGLLIENGGKITGNTSATSSTQIGATLNITVQNGDVLLAASGASILSQQLAGSCNVPGEGGQINLIANGLGATITTEVGTTISVNGNKCPAGDITIVAPNQGVITIAGSVLSESGGSGTGTNQRPGGGTIRIRAACALDELDTGVISSKGADPGADLVHLEAGCDVTIEGLVQSTGEGHVVPNSPTNHCSPVVAGTTGCVEIWAGRDIFLNRDAAGLNGQINVDLHADIGFGWINLFAVRNIVVTNNTAVAAIHANNDDGSGIARAGEITLKSRDGFVDLTGLAIQANAVASGGDGGPVIVEAFLDVDLRGATIQAMGNAVSGIGGTIAVQSFSQSILSDAGSTLSASGNTLGNVSLTACVGPIGFPPGTVVGNVVKVLLCPGTHPFIPVTLPDCGQCGGGPNPPGFCNKSTVQSVLNPVTGRYPANAGPDVIVEVQNGGIIQNAVTGLFPNGDLNGDGYIIIGVVGKDNGVLGGHTTQNVEISGAYTLPFALIACSVTVHAADSAIPTGNILDSASAPAPPGATSGGIFVMDLHAMDSLAAGWLVGGDDRVMRNINTFENFVGMSFVGDGNTMHNGRSEDNLDVGIKVEGGQNTVRDADAFGNGSHGVQVIGNTNVVRGVDSGDRGKENAGDGFNVTGNGNKLIECDAYANALNGITVTGNGNEITKCNAGDKGKGNGGTGIDVAGNLNVLTQNDAYANGGDGVEVVGNTNTIKGNITGDAGKGNGRDGLRVDGSTNTLDGNRSNGNTGVGINLVKAAGTGNKLKSNQSNTSSAGGNKENLLAEYCFAEGTSLDLGSNKKDNANFVGVGSPKKYAAGCYE